MPQDLKDYTTDAKPLTQLTSKGVHWMWGKAEEATFEKLKRGLISAPVLGYRNPKQSYILNIDVSTMDIGAVLSQIQGGKERVIAYYIKTLSLPKRNYCVTRWGLLAVVKAVKHCCPHLYGQHFTLRTDNASLK